MKIILLGTAWPYRGGLASFNERLITEFIKNGHDAEIITFTVQYPTVLFPGKTQYSTSPPPFEIKIDRKVNSINPLNWRNTAKEIKGMAPDLLIIKYWMPFMAPCFSVIAKIVKQNNKTKVICIADNIIPHERNFYDNLLTRRFIRQCDAFVVMSKTVLSDLKKFDQMKPVALTPHPLFDNFGGKITKGLACEKLHLDPLKNYILFFGFVREYKGLDILLKAFADERLKALPLELIIAGEYYSGEKECRQLMEDLKLGDRIIQFNHFIPDEEVKNFFCAADIVVQPYKHATQSGVTQIAYHFDVPMIVTNVGGLSEMVPDNKVGYVVNPKPNEIADALVDFYSNNKKALFIENIREEKKRFGWDKMMQTIIDLSNKVD
ncbi:MAG: glycosyltransferase [Chitinophagales bacterium]